MWVKKNGLYFQCPGKMFLMSIIKLIGMMRKKPTTKKEIKPENTQKKD
jgi:hypothetical protein